MHSSEGPSISSVRAVPLLLLGLAGGGGIGGGGGGGGHVVLVRPGDEAVRREAAVALLGTPERPLAHGHLALLGGGGGRRGGVVLGGRGRGGVAERTPALDAVEAGQVGVEVDPHRGLLQLRVPAEQVAVAVHERLEHLHQKQSLIKMIKD